MKKDQKQRYSRRDFIGQASRLTAAGVVLGRLPARSKMLNSIEGEIKVAVIGCGGCLLYTSPSPRDGLLSRMPSSA